MSLQKHDTLETKTVLACDCQQILLWYDHNTYEKMSSICKKYTYQLKSTLLKKVQMVTFLPLLWPLE